MDNNITGKKTQPYVAIPLKMLLDTNLSPHALKLFMILKNKMFFDSKPNNEVLSKAMGLSEDRISTYLKELRDNNYIKLEYETSSFSVNKCAKSRKITLPKSTQITI
jgi:hypothetical protein